MVLGIPGGAPPGPPDSYHGLLAGADLVVGGQRHLAALDPLPARTLALHGDLEETLDSIAAESGTVCVLASGDPGYFGILRALAARFGAGSLEVHPAVSSVSLAFARLGLPWDDAVVVSAHGRSLADAVRAIPAHPSGVGGELRLAKSAVLVSPENPPEAVASLLVELGAAPGSRAVVCARLGYPEEEVTDTDLAGVAAGRWDPLSVLLLLPPDPVAPVASLATPSAAAGARLYAAGTAGAAAGTGEAPAGTGGAGGGAGAAGGASGPVGGASGPVGGTAGSHGGTTAHPGEHRHFGAIFGRDDSELSHRAGMITKPEVRAVVLARLRLPAAGVLWDLGAGSGSVGVEAAGLAPGLEVVAVERDPDAARQITLNAARHDVGLLVVQAEAPAALDGLADPNRVFVGGGGLRVLGAALERLRPGGRVVATFAALDRAAAAADLLGNLVQLSVARGARLPDGGLRLEASSPVFLVWGPDGDNP